MALQPNKVIPPDFPEVANMTEAEELLSSFGEMSRLTNKQRAVLMAITEDMFLEEGEKRRTNGQIAKACGVHIKSVDYMLANPRFNSALGMMMVAVVRGETHLYVGAMRKLALSGHFSATKFMLEYGGTYTKRSQVETKNLNVNMSRTAPEDYDAALDSLLITLGGQGYSANMIVDRYNRLKAEGAF